MNLFLASLSLIQLFVSVNMVANLASESKSLGTWFKVFFTVWYSFTCIDF